MAATKSPGRDGDEPQPRSAPILHTTSPLESGEILCRCGWVYWISNFCCGLGWLGRMEIGNPSMIKLTFEVWHLKHVWQGESDIDAIFVLMVARIGCICHLCWGVDQRLEVMDSIVTIDTGSEDTKIPGPAGPGRLWWERATNSLPYVDCHYEWWSWD